jgi:hypothetical protein
MKIIIGLKIKKDKQVEIEKWMVEKGHPMQNYVLTTTVYATDKIKLGYLELYQDTRFNPELHQPIVQRVVSIPKRLYYGKEQRFITLDKGFDPGINHNREETISINPPVRNSMPWKTTLDIKKDDTVYVDSFTLVTAEQGNRVFTVGKTVYYLVKYEDIYFKLVNGEPIMLNGWVMCEPITSEDNTIMKHLKEIGFIFPGIKIDNDNRKKYSGGDKLAKVRYIGPPVDEYIDETEVHDEISVNDIVILKWTANRRLELYGNRFFGNTELVVTRRERVVGKFTESLF